ncbi:hypothetical protein [Treponema sp.]|uniref:hypothetical protein n=1 Tax=Treponema sp. TaxID=166 RepID=UPI00389049AD
MLATCRLEEFIIEFIGILNEETEEQTLWEYYLHKVFDKSFQDFKEQISEKAKADSAPMTDEKLKRIVADSFNIIGDFAPIPE